VALIQTEEISVNSSPDHAGVIATFKRAEAEAAHKFGLIKAAATKGPKAIQAAVETADKAAKRRDAFAKKLVALGIEAQNALADDRPQKET
jgi:heterodisulfide reductase subunit A-like polyferredoxin